MKRANTNKLSINKETVRALSDEEMSRINGGGVVYESARCQAGGAAAGTTSSSVLSGAIIGSYVNSVYVYGG